MLAIVGLTCCTLLVLKLVIPAASVASIPRSRIAWSPRANARENSSNLIAGCAHVNDQRPSFKTCQRNNPLTIFTKSSSVAFSAFFSNNANHSPKVTIGRASSRSAFCVMIERRTYAMMSAHGARRGLTMLSAGGGALYANAVSKSADATSSSRNQDTA